jgi:preprotein translocase subunit SecD
MVEFASHCLIVTNLRDLFTLQTILLKLAFKSVLKDYGLTLTTIAARIFAISMNIAIITIKRA